MISKLDRQRAIAESVGSFPGMKDAGTPDGGYVFRGGEEDIHVRVFDGKVVDAHTVTQCKSQRHRKIPAGSYQGLLLTDAVLLHMQGNEKAATFYERLSIG